MGCHCNDRRVLVLDGIVIKFYDFMSPSMMGFDVLDL
jgi:hypothetical protein